MRGAFRNMARQMRLKMRFGADRADAGAAAAMRNAERLVKVHVANIGADVARAGEADEGVQVGAVEIDLPAMLVHDGTDVLGSFLEHAMRGRVGEHQGRKI